jgi:Domain of unknown function (DUF4397)
VSVRLVRRIAVAAAAALVAGGLSIVDASPAAAATTGYVRLAHLSPDTDPVDVYLSSLAGAFPRKKFPGVGYGVVSAYQQLPTGTYAVSMRLSGHPESEPPVLTTEVTVAGGKAYTVAGVGKNSELGLKVIDDDLTLPPSGTSKVRIVQASISVPLLDISVMGGASIATGVPFAATTAYQNVAPGKWTLQLRPTNGGQASTLGADLGSGNVYSLIVLDKAGGGLTVELRVDARRQGGVPTGGVNTGAGGTKRGSVLPAILGGLLVLLAGAGLIVAMSRRLRIRRA